MEKVEFIAWVIDTIRTRVMTDNKLILKYILGMPNNIDRIINFKTRCKLTSDLLYFICKGVEKDVFTQEIYHFNDSEMQLNVLQIMNNYEEENKNYAITVYIEKHVYCILRMDDQIVRYESSLGDYTYKITPDYFNDIFNDKEIDCVRLFEIPSIQEIVDNVDALYQETEKFIKKHPEYHHLYEILNSPKW